MSDTRFSLSSVFSNVIKKRNSFRFFDKKVLTETVSSPSTNSITATSSFQIMGTSILKSPVSSNEIRKVKSEKHILKHNKRMMAQKVLIKLSVRSTASQICDIFAIGQNKYGKLGVGDADDRDALTKLAYNAMDIATGDHHTVILSDDGKVKTFGNNHRGVLGVDKAMKESHVPVSVSTLENYNIVKIACGASYSLALSDKGELFCWGGNQNGTLGLSDNKARYIPEKLKYFEGKVIVDVRSGGHHVVVQLSDGDFYSWGLNEFNELGLGQEYKDYDIIDTPHQILDMIPYQHRVVSYETGHRFTIVLLNQGGVVAFGCNINGELGVGDVKPRFSPVEITALQDKGIIDIVCGNSSTYALTYNGNLYVWGSNTRGQLGCNNCMEALLPVLCPISSISKVYASISDTLVIYKTLNGNFQVFGTDDEKKKKLQEELNSLGDKQVKMVKIGWNSAFVMVK